MSSTAVPFRDSGAASWRVVVSEWMVECIAALLSALSVICLAVLLARNDGHPSFDWNGVTLNTLVSLLSTVSRLSLTLVLAQAISQTKWIMFARSRRRLYDFELADLASRGVIGCLKVLWQIPLGFSSLGAIAALLALAFDPFAQQLVQTRVAESFINDARSILPTANRYSQGVLLNPHVDVAPPSQYPFRVFMDPLLTSTGACNGSFPSPWSASADFRIQTAVLQGLGQTGNLQSIVQQLAPSCPSENCTWKPVESLAVCSKCNNLQDQLTSYKTDLQSMEFPLEFPVPATAFSLSNGLWIMNLDESTYDKLSGKSNDITSADSEFFAATILASYGTGNPADTNTFQEADTLIWAISILQAMPDPASSSTVWPSLPIRAAECALYYCTNTYTAQMQNGILAEAEQLSPTNSTRNPNSWQPISPIQFTPSQLSSLQFDRCISMTPRTDLTLGPGFNLSYEAVISISYFMNTTFALTDTVIRDPSDQNATKRANGFYNFTGSGGDKWDPPAMQLLMQSPDLNFTFAAIARGMTNALRTHGQSVAPWTGKTGSSLILIHVRWAWIALPVTVVMIGLAQLTLSMYVSRSSRAPLWKSSALAGLSRAHGAAELLAGCGTLAEMENVSRKETVDLLGSSGDDEFGPVGAGEIGHGAKPGPQSGVRDVEGASSNDFPLRASPTHNATGRQLEEGQSLIDEVGEADQR